MPCLPHPSSLSSSILHALTFTLFESYLANCGTYSRNYSCIRLPSSYASCGYLGL
jgi:hypothetical protein